MLYRQQSSVIKQINKAGKKVTVDVSSLRYDEWRWLDGDKRCTKDDKKWSRKANRRMSKHIIINEILVWHGGYCN